MRALIIALSIGILACGSGRADNEIDPLPSPRGARGSRINLDDNPIGSFRTGGISIKPVRATICGDGLVDAGEACDDGNTVSGDGCSSTCTIEQGFSCSGAPSTCTTSDLTGNAIPLALQCAGTVSKTQAPNVTPSVTRASHAICTKSDGTVVELLNNQPRIERMGWLIEPASTGNLISNPRDLSNAAWTKSNITCAHTATGADNASNSASTCTATAPSGAVTQALTVASANRSTSMRMKRRTGTGSVLVSRNAFVSSVDIAASLSSSTWKWVRSSCGSATGDGAGYDSHFNRIDNCIEVPILTATAANPTISIQVAVNNDAVDIDYVQDEASDYATSPQAGFTRAAEIIDDSTDIASLPTTQGELSVDLTTLYTAGTTAGQQWVIQTDANDDLHCGVLLATNSGSGFAISNIVKTNSGDQILTASAAQTTGVGQNIRVSWGSGKETLWNNGYVIAQNTSGTLNMPACHTRYLIGSAQGGAGNFAGWISRIRWASGAISSFHGSAVTVRAIGDSIVNGHTPCCGPNADGSRPAQALATDMHAGLNTEKYVFNDGLDANTVDQCATRWNNFVSLITAAGTQSTTILLWQCGINSVGGGQTDAQVWATIQTALESAIAAGIRVQPATITAANGVADINVVNDFMRAWGSAHDIVIADTYAVLVDPALPFHLNPLYDSGDNGHPNTAGDLVMAASWYNAGHANGYW